MIFNIYSIHYYFYIDNLFRYYFWIRFFCFCFILLKFICKFTNVSNNFYGHPTKLKSKPILSKWSLSEINTNPSTKFWRHIKKFLNNFDIFLFSISNFQHSPYFVFSWIVFWVKFGALTRRVRYLSSADNALSLHKSIFTMRQTRV